MTTLDKCRSQANRKQVLSYCRPVFNSIFLYQMTSLISLQQIFCYFTSSAADFKFVIYLCFIQRERFHSFWAAWRVVVLQQAVYNLNIHSIHCHLFVTLEILMYSKSVNIELVECLLFSLFYWAAYPLIFCPLISFQIPLPYSRIIMEISMEIS